MKICPITSRYSTAELESLKYTNKVLRRENIDFIIKNDFLAAVKTFVRIVVAKHR